MRKHVASLQEALASRCGRGRLLSVLLHFSLLGLQLLCVLCLCLILIHAFERSLGTGLMVLLIPFYTVYYAFFQFEHRFRRWIVAGLIGCGVAAVSFRLLLNAPSTGLGFK